MTSFLEPWVLVVEAILVGTWFYWFISKKYSFWTARGVPGPKPWPLLGDLPARMFSDPMLELEYIAKYPRMYGYYFGLTPVLTVCDPELIKQVMIKDFPFLVNHRPVPAYHDVFSKILVTLEGEDWKRIRTIVTPGFTSGKLRSMYPLMNVCIERLCKHLGKISQNSNAEVDLRDLFTTFTIDVISSTAFGTEINFNYELSSSNPYVKYCKKIAKFPYWKMLCIVLVPQRLHKLEHVFPDDAADFLLSLVKQIVKDRQSGKTPKRNDLVQMLLDAYVYDEELSDGNYHKLAVSTATDKESTNDSTTENQTAKSKSGTVKKLSEQEIVAQAIQFFMAGFETTATTLAHMAYELAKNPEIQDRLVGEILSVTGPLDESNDSQKRWNQLSETVNTKIPYLDAVIKETLRMYPPLTRLERRVGIEGYKLEGIPLEKEMLIEISPIGVHYNPEYYPDPHQFNPDRWMPENKDSLIPYTYLPFGDGPRNCVGMRFAYQEIKLCIAPLITRYQFRRNAKTPDRLRFRKATPMLTIDELYVDVALR